MVKFWSKCVRNYKVLFGTILLMIFVLIIVSQLLAMGYQKICPISTSDKLALEDKLDMVLTDFNNFNKLKNVDVNVGENEIELVFGGENCDLEVTTNKEFDVISKNFKDNRFLAQSSNIFLLGIGGLVLALSFALWTSLFLDLLVYCNRKKNKKMYDGK